MALILDGNGLIQGLDAGGLPSGSVNADSLASTLDLSSKTMTFGNVSASGITFPATQSASSNANTLDDYEEGTWTPTGNGVTLTGASGWYTKIGNVVYIGGRWAYPNTADGNAAQVTGLPFTVANLDANYNGCVAATNYGSDNLYMFTEANGTTVLARNNTNANLTNANLSQKFINFFALYRV
jgi:hypothetical protein